MLWVKFLPKAWLRGTQDISGKCVFTVYVCVRGVFAVTACIGGSLCLYVFLYECINQCFCLHTYLCALTLYFCSHACTCSYVSVLCLYLYVFTVFLWFSPLDIRLSLYRLIYVESVTRDCFRTHCFSLFLSEI